MGRFIMNRYYTMTKDVPVYFSASMVVCI
jgi:hypothetical protein